MDENMVLSKIVDDLRRDLRLALNNAIVQRDMVLKLTAVLCEHDLAIEAAEIVGVETVEAAQKTIGNAADCYD